MFGAEVIRLFGSVDGDQLINKKIEKLIAKGSKSAARAGISKGLTVIARGIRKAVPPKLKSVKKTVSQRFLKTKDKHKMDAKVGLGVGKQTKSKKDRPGNRPGVGIVKENIHWWTLGTKERKWKTISGQGTGRMPKGPPVVKQGFDATKKEARRIIIATIKAKIKAEAKKKKARARAKGK